MAGPFVESNLQDNIENLQNSTPEQGGAKMGYYKSNGISLVGLMGKGNVKNSPGFTPNELYQVENRGLAPNGWYGQMLKSHIENLNPNLTPLTTSRRFDTQKEDWITPISKRDYLLKFNDTSSDYLLHNFQLDGRRPTPDERGNAPSRVGTTPYENNDPVMYGFEVIVDAASSPLLNGSVEDFITQFSVISEVQSRMPIIMEFKRQFAKLFKTKGAIRQTVSGGVVISPLLGKPEELEQIAGTPPQKDMHQPGSRAYMSYYVQKISGLSKLAESNTSGGKKYLVDYRKDLITLSFLEDVSATMGTLAHLYKLLYWSKPNGKNIIPENLLRFNCEIVVSECRNFNRVVAAANNNQIEVIKDNVSRYIYSLRECQLFFDKMPHDDTIDMSNIKSFGDSASPHDVSFDYKYSTLNFEKWTDDGQRFGNYVGYNGGSIWRKDSTTGTEKPAFRSIGQNLTNQNGVDNPEIFWAGSLSGEGQPTGAADLDKKVGNEPSVNEDTTIPDANYNVNTKPVGKVSTSISGSLEQFKNASVKNAAKIVAKKAKEFVAKEVKNQVNMRLQLLNGTLAKIKNALGISNRYNTGNPQAKLYPRPYSPHSFGIFFDVRNDLYNFLGEDLATIMQNGTNIINPTRDPSNPRANPIKRAINQGRGIYKNNSDYTANTLGSIKNRFGRK